MTERELTETAFNAALRDGSRADREYWYRQLREVREKEAKSKLLKAKVFHKDPEIQVKDSMFSMTGKMMAEVVDLQDDMFVDAIRRVAQEAGITDLYLIDKKALLEMLDRSFWIDVSVRKPQPGKRIEFTDGIFVGEGYMDDSGEFFRYYEGRVKDVLGVTVTHWKELPPPPGRKEGA